MTKLVLSNKRQLIDINEDATLFDIDVTVTADSKYEFQAAVVNQTQLDAGDINYQVFSGNMGVKVKNDKNVYQNHFLVLKSEKPGNVEVTLMKNQPPPPFQPAPPPEIPEIFAPPIQQPLKVKKSQSIFTMRTLFIILVLVGLGVGLFFMWRGSPSVDKDISVCETPSVANSVAVAPSVSETISPPTKVASPNLMSRLHKLAE